MNKDNNYVLFECRSLTPLLAALDDILKNNRLKMTTYKRTGSAYNTVVLKGELSSCLDSIKIAKKSILNLTEKTTAEIKAAGVSQFISAIVITNPEKEIENIFFSKNNKMQNNNLNQGFFNDSNSLAFIDSRGLIALIAAADELLENYPLKIVGCKKMGSGRLTLIIAGKIDVLKNAVLDAENIVKKHGKLIGSSLINNADPQILSTFYRSDVNVS